MRYLSAIVLFACAPQSAEKPEDTEGLLVDIDWGSWEIHTTFTQQDEICSDLGADGQGLGVLYGEMDVDETTTVSMSLGDQNLSGERNDTGFVMKSFRSIPVTGAEEDEYGIGAELTAFVTDLHSFNGTLVYQLDFPNGYCTIESEVDAYWMYYEPPPACGG
jgi:hypothetical protein